jgi:hypothetical protein
MPRRLDEFPDAADLALLKDYQLNCSKRLIEEMDAEPTQTKWRDLAEVTLSRTLVFNARRGMEITDLTMTEYENRINNVPANILGTMSCRQATASL